MPSTTATSPLQFFGETLATAAGGLFVGEEYTHKLDELFEAAKGDQTIELVVVLRKGDDVALLGIRNGELITDNAGFRRVLLPITTRI